MVGHIVGTSVSSTALPLACFLLAPHVAHHPRWRGWALYSVATGIGMMGLGIASVLITTGGGPAGLFERLSIAVIALWTSVLAGRLLAGTPLTDPAGRADHTRGAPAAAATGSRS